MGVSCNLCRKSGPGISYDNTRLNANNVNYIIKIYNSANKAALAEGWSLMKAMSITAWARALYAGGARGADPVHMCPACLKTIAEINSKVETKKHAKVSKSKK